MLRTPIASCVVTFLLLVCLAPAASTATRQQVAPPVDRVLARELVRLDHQLGLGTLPDGSGLWIARYAVALEYRLRQPAVGSVPGRDLMRRLARQLRQLGVEYDLAGPGRPGADPSSPDALAEPERAARARRLRETLRTVRMLQVKVDRLARGGLSGHRLLTRAAPVNDSCFSATAVGEGTVSGSTSEATNDATASCGSSNTSPDVWYRYTATEEGPVSFDTFGSAYDTVLTLFDGCPNDGRGNELACNDDAAGTAQSRLIFDMTTGDEVWVRVSGFGGAAGSFDLTIGDAQGIFGTVTASESGAPLSGVEVEVFDDSLFLEEETTTDGDGTYFLGILEDGTYTVRTRDTAGRIDETYDDVPCLAWTSCLSDGTPVVVSGSEVTGIDFALSPAASISGSVTSAATGGPLDGAHVSLAGLDGLFLTSAISGSDGGYEIDGLAAGKYYLRALAQGHRPEVYDDLPCESPCDVTDGTQVPVTVGGAATGIDFSLDRFGAVAGVVTEEGSGAAADAVRVELYRQSGTFYTSTFTAGDGSYEFAGLPAGTYFVKTDSIAHRNELYDDLPCTGFCDVTTGTPVAVNLNATTGGIDFSLVALGSVSGSVTHAVSGAPLANLRVDIYDDAGSFVDWGRTLSTGVYLIDGLEPGDYFLRTSSSGTFADELYDEQPCQPSCSVLSGTPVGVSTGAEVSGIDFTLDELGAITGTVTDADSGTGLGAIVHAFDDSGSAVASDIASASGDYRLDGLTAGTYYVRAVLSSHVSELYDDIPTSSVNDVTEATPVDVSLNSTTSGIDIALTRLGEISGRLTDASTGGALSFDSVDLYTESGVWYASESTDSIGDYVFQGLPPGTYHVRTATFSHRNEVYDDVPCHSPTIPCDVTTGTPIVAELGNPVTGIDFVLDSLGEISGHVVDATNGSVLQFGGVELYDASGAVVAAALTSSTGNYSFDVPAGDYYVRARPNGYAAEVYDDILCLTPCVPTTGSPVSVSLGATTSGIDFALRRLGVIEGSIRAADSGELLAGFVQLFDAELQPVITQQSSFSAGFEFINLTPGTYYVRSVRNTTADDYQDELFADVPCEPTCDISLGTPLPVVLDGLVSGVDLVLHTCPADSYETVVGTTYFSVALERACERLTAGSGTSVQPGADVTFAAGRSIVLGDGFSVQSGGSFKAVIEPAWAED